MEKGGGRREEAAAAEKKKDINERVKGGRGREFNNVMGGGRGGGVSQRMCSPWLSPPADRLVDVYGERTTHSCRHAGRVEDVSRL